jgi:hypothetical protein
MNRRLHNCVQATPGCALLFILAQVSGAPDAERSAHTIQRLLISVVLLMAVGCCYAEAPKLFRGQSVNAADLAEALNHFVRLGETATVKELNDLASEETGNGTDHRVGWMCRLLFRPKGKEPLLPPPFGLLDLGNVGVHTTTGQILETWPLYPFALSGSTYFVLGDRYSFDGWSAGVKAYIADCRTNGVFRTKPVKVPTRKQAMKDAAALRQSKAWKAIKWQDIKKGEGYGSEAESWSFIQSQAASIPTP